jgi:hypothetical protein
MKMSHLKLSNDKFADLRSEDGQCAALFDDYRNLKKIKGKIFPKAQLLYVKMILFSYPVGVENVPSWRVTISNEVKDLFCLRYYDIDPTASEERWRTVPGLTANRIEVSAIADGLCWLLDELGIRYRINNYPLNAWRYYEIVPYEAVFINDFDALAKRFLDRGNAP